MKAIRMSRTGGPEVLEYVDMQDPLLGPDEALVAVGAIGVNFIDTYVRRGTYPRRLPLIPGFEMAGTVAAVGAEVANVEIGDRVAMAGLAMGSYADTMVVPARHLVDVPADVSLDAAAAVLEQGLTAHYLCHSTYALQAGDVALVHAGAGGVGRLLTQMAKRIGATVISTVSTNEKAEMSRSVGADHVVLYTERDFQEEAMTITDGQGVDVVYDSVGKSTIDKSLASLKPRGMMILYGAASGVVQTVPVSVINARSLFFTRPGLTHYIASRDELVDRSSDVFEWVRSGGLSVHIHAKYPLSEAGRAQDDLEQRRTMGKVLLVP